MAARLTCAFAAVRLAGAFAAARLEDALVARPFVTVVLADFSVGRLARTSADVFSNAFSRIFRSRIRSLLEVPQIEKAE